MTSAAPDRIAALDLTRGVAVLGILAVNIAGFAGPIAATLSPHVPAPGTLADEWTFAAVFVLFEGKMRALFSMLFGASMVLLIERNDESGRDGIALQVRRLLWLALLGYLHYALLWWGDILFLYAVIGTGALAMRALPLRQLTVVALLVFTLWHGAAILRTAPAAIAEERVRISQATPAQRDLVAGNKDDAQRQTAQEVAVYRGTYAAQLQFRVAEHPFRPLGAALFNLGETLPFMLLGMALFRSGLFTGQWPRRQLRQLAGWSLLAGGLPTIAAALWLLPRHFPVEAMHAATAGWMGLPHLLMALGYAAVLVMAAPRLLAHRIGRYLANAGRMALSNYVGTTLVMAALFQGWGLGLFGTVPDRWQPLIVAMAWAAMLAGSTLWLARYRQGPLEWLWRSLTEWRMLPLRRSIVNATHSH